MHRTCATLPNLTHGSICAHNSSSHLSPLPQPTTNHPLRRNESGTSRTLCPCVTLWARVGSGHFGSDHQSRQTRTSNGTRRIGSGVPVEVVRSYLSFEQIVCSGQRSTKLHRRVSKFVPPGIRACHHSGNKVDIRLLQGSLPDSYSTVLFFPPRIEYFDKGRPHRAGNG